jgi:hypothetical protein
MNKRTTRFPGAAAGMWKDAADFPPLRTYDHPGCEGDSVVFYREGIVSGGFSGI